MTPSRNEHTIATTCEVQGRGYWSGKQVRVVMHPAQVGTGITLVRSDIAGSPNCQVDVAHRTDANLRTIISKGEARFEMIEHLMAALAGLEVDNCLVEIDSEELPGLDGSSAAYVEALRHAGLIIQPAPRRRIVVREPIRVSSSGGWVEATPLEKDVASFEYQLSFDDTSVIRPQKHTVKLTPHQFIRDVASARTFVTAEQAEILRSQGVASHVTNKDLLVIGADGPIDNRYRFANECARHKLLDLIGDLALVNAEIVGNITSYRGGHNLNGQMASHLSKLACESACNPHFHSIRKSKQDRHAA